MNKSLQYLCRKIQITTLLFVTGTMMSATHAFMIQNVKKALLTTRNKAALKTTPISYFPIRSRSTTRHKWGENDDNEVKNVFVDENGRTIRKTNRSSQTSNKWSDDDYNTEKRQSGGNKWSDDDYNDRYESRNNNQRSSQKQRINKGRSNDNDYRGRSKRTSFGYDGRQGNGRYDRSDRNNYRNDRSNNKSSFEGRYDRSDRNNYQYDRSNNNSSSEGRINIRSLEDAGLEHLYGLTPVLNALRSKRRNLKPHDDLTNMTWEEEEQRGVKLEAQSRPMLFIQEKKQGSHKTGDKAKFAQEIEMLAHEMMLPIAKVDKGVLNALSSNRPHQGYVLRTYNLPFTQVDRLGNPNDSSSPLLYLVLDEVVDPQNFGALLRSAYFLSGDGGNSIQVVTSAKNSAPPSATVSAASAGAMEVMTVLSTNNLPKLLSRAKEDNWNIIGAAAAVEDDEDSKFHINLKDVSILEPSILVLGSEGFGLRRLVANCCSGFVRIGNDDGDGDYAVDSLNVSVTGGITMWHLLNRIRR